MIKGAVSSRKFNISCPLDKGVESKDVAPIVDMECFMDIVGDVEHVKTPLEYALNRLIEASSIPIENLIASRQTKVV